MKRIFQPWLTERLQRFKTDIAIEYGNKTFTYENIHRQSDGIAGWIVNNGIKKETFIGIYTPDRVELIIAIIGILKAGCVFVPLDPAHPAARLEAVVESVGLTYIIGDTSGRTFFRGGRVLSFRQLLSARCLKNTGVQYTPEDKIYVYFTSGSTGTPKAIVGKNKSLHHFIDWELETFAITPGCRISQFIAPGFDAFLRDVFVSLCSGGTLCIPRSSGILLDPDACARWIDEQEIHLIHCVPSLFRVFNAGALTPSHFQSLKYILLSGERINPADLAGWYDTFAGRIQLVNFYGPTETTMIKTFYRIRKSDLSKERIPIGVPMKGARVIIFNDKMKVCDELITGEIYIRTPYRTFGYYNDEPSNREKFLPNPLNNDPNDILFKTGDLGRYLPDGNIEFLGRKDRQVKIRGVRVELEEIENSLPAHPLVAEAAVVSREELCAYITVVNGGKSLTEQEKQSLPGELRDYLAEKLPEVMLPSFFIVLEKLPLTAIGKIDWKALPEPQTPKTAEYTAPRGPGEEKIAAIWREVLYGGDDLNAPPNHPPIGIDDNFFLLGGQSLKATLMLTKIHRELDVRVPLAEVLKTPTIRRVSDYIAAAEKEKISPVEPVEKREYYPLSSAQKRLYVIQQMDPGSTAYNVPSAVMLEGAVDTRRMEEIFKVLVDRHESFRTSFRMVNEEPVQRIHDTVDGRQWFMGSEGFVRPFDLAKAPLLRMGIEKAADNRHKLMVDMHHIAADGLSMGIFVREFVRLYNGEKLFPLRLQYKDFCYWQNREREKGVLKKQEEFWLRQFAGDIPKLKLPADYPESPTVGFAGSRYKKEIHETLAAEIKEFAGRGGTTPHQFFLAVYTILLSRYSRREDILVGTPVTGRTHADFQGVTGMFVNMLALRNRPEGGKTFRLFLEEVKATVLAAYENQDYPFEELVARLGLQGETDKNPLFDVAFALHTLESQEAESDSKNDLKVTPLEFETDVSIFDITLRTFEAPGSLSIVFEYKTTLFKSSTIEKYANRYIEILEQVVDNPDIQLKDITLSHELLPLKTDVLTDEKDFRF